MNDARTITRRDADVVLKLIADLRELPAGRARYLHLLDTLCQLLQAQVGCVGLQREAAGGRPYAAVAMADVGWTSSRERDVAISYCEQARYEDHYVRDPMVTLLKQPVRVLTRRRREIVADREWYRAGNVSEVRRPSGIDDCIYALHRLPGASWVAGIALHRPWGDRGRFRRRDCEVLDLVNTHLGWMWTEDLSARPDAQLPPRLRQTLELLMSGRSEKEIAAEMRLSRFTVHKYVTALYRRHGVSSRAQLLSMRLPPRNGAIVRPNPWDVR